MMIPRCLVVVMVAGACGEVARQPLADAPVPVPDVGAPTTYKGTMDQAPAKMFGGTLGTVTYCTYTMTLRQLNVDLGIVASSKQVTSGHVQNINVEAVVATMPPCPYSPAPPVIANYTFKSATLGTTGMMLMFDGDPANATKVNLAINLSSSPTGYSAAMTFHRTDQGPPLDWSVPVTLALTPQ
jgi:hypothetical protein